MNEHPERPLVIYDGDCGFCRAWVDYWKKLTADRVLYSPFQQLSDPFHGITHWECATSVQLLLPDGKKFSGAHAVFNLLSIASERGLWIRIYESVPGVAPVTELFYRFIARHRSVAYWVTKLLWGIPLENENFTLAGWLFLRLLGLIYLIAFLSFGVQASGLIGSHGILPAADFLSRARLNLGSTALWRIPTLLWLNRSDAAISLIWLAGALVSAVQLAGLNWRSLRVAQFALYLSLVSAGQDFMGYQWDALLLEAGFLAIFLGWSPLIVKLYRWLLFRLMFLSGAVKLLSHDPTWRRFTALPVHYETQPLPTAPAWFFYQLPSWFQRVSVGFVFSVELFIPFLILAPRRLRLFAGAAITVLQALIAITGNYAFFNLLTVALCLFLLNDAALLRFLPDKILRRIPKASPKSTRFPTRAVSVVVYVLVLLVSALEMVGTFSGRHWAATDKVIDAAAPFELVNTYGLFAVMTTTRLEIIVEGSNDGVSWLPYEFKYKPGDLARRPTWVAPHQPRLDWQMWFAALGDYRSAPWILHFMERLLEGSPEVLGLLRHNPFPISPPHYVRALLYQYHFSSPEQKRKNGNWWWRELQGEYLPAISLRPASENRPTRPLPERTLPSRAVAQIACIDTDLYRSTDKPPLPYCPGFVYK
jgi:predicted DCC family thiol-disulfide oxidoreductase YuxK